MHRTFSVDGEKRAIEIFLDMPLEKMVLCGVFFRMVRYLFALQTQNKHTCTTDVVDENWMCSKLLLVLQ